MDTGTSLDRAVAHRALAEACYDAAWELIDKADRTPDEVDAMLHVAHAAAWHWSQWPEHTAQDVAMANWQLSRVYALAGHAELAIHYAERCLEVSRGLPPLYLGYAYEALARAARIEGERVLYAESLARARALTFQVDDPDARVLLNTDLDALAA